jgi:peptide chain release factor 1
LKSEPAKGATTRSSWSTSSSTSTRSTETGGGFSIACLEDRPGYLAFRAEGKNAREAFEKEAGGHKWQRVPPTEKRGRKQSSTITVAVLTEPTQQELTLNPKDLKYETYKDSGPGGQHRNTSDTAVRVTHIPTGVQASSAHKCQSRNKKLALAALRARLSSQKSRQAATSRNNKRKRQVGTGMRADKIRTVAEQRGRVENHRNGRRMKIKRYLRGYVEEIY